MPLCEIDSRRESSAKEDLRTCVEPLYSLGSATRGFKVRGSKAHDCPVCPHDDNNITLDLVVLAVQHIDEGNPA